MDVDAYLQRIRFDQPVTRDPGCLEGLMRAHLEAVPFENIDVFNGESVGTEVAWSYEKVVERGRGGWCFELNGAFAGLLEELGFEVARLGAAVLLGGPTTIVDHLVLEVRLDEAYLVDVGFGDSFCRPLLINQRGPQDGGTGTFELIASPEGTTLTRHGPDGTPEPQYRFKRVTLAMTDFEAASRRLQDDKDAVWHTQAFATRYLDGGPDRVTLIGNRLKIERTNGRTDSDVADDEWTEVLDRWFGMQAQLATPADRRTARSADG